MTGRDTELYLIGALLNDSKMAYYAVREEGVTGSSFTHPDTKLLWETAVSCIKVAGSVDRYALLSALRGRDEAQKIVDHIPRDIDPASVAVHARAIRQHEKQNQFADLINRSHDQNIDKAITGLATDLMAIHHGDEVHRVKSVADYKQPILEAVAHAGEGENEFGRLSFITEVNQWAVAYPYGKISVLGAYRGLGKSSVAKQEVLTQARAYGPAGLLSTEDGAMDISLGFACLNGAGYMWRYQRGFERGNALSVHLDEVAALPIHIMDSRQDIHQVCENITLLAVRHGCRFVVCDYLQDIDTPKGMVFRGGENEKYTYFMGCLARVVKQTNVAFLLLSQFSRDMEKHDRPPKLSDLRASGTIEQVAKRVYLMYKDPDTGNYIVEGAKIGMSGKGGDKKAYLRHCKDHDGFEELGQ